MNITGGTNLSLFEVHEAAEIVSDASDPEVNMIFGSVINENLKDEIVVTVIATGFEEADESQPSKSPSRGTGLNNRPQQSASYSPANNSRPAPQQQRPQEETPEPQQRQQPQQEESDALDIPTFLRNRRKRR